MPWWGNGCQVSPYPAKETMTGFLWSSSPVFKVFNGWVLDFHEMDHIKCFCCLSNYSKAYKHLKQLLAWNEWRSQGDPDRQSLRFLSLSRTWGGLRCHTAHSLAKRYVTALQTSTPGSQKWGFLAPSLALSEMLLSSFWECAVEMSKEQSYLSLLFLIKDRVTTSKKSKTESQITTPLKGINSCSICY